MGRDWGVYFHAEQESSLALYAKRHIDLYSQLLE